MDGKKAWRLEEVRLDAVEIPQGLVRSVASERKMEELRKSVKEHGVLVPIIVEETEGGYRLIAGTRRMIVSGDAGLATIPAVIVQESDDWKAWATITENRVREAVNAFDEGRYVAMMLEKTGKSKMEIGRLLGVSDSWVHSRLGILHWPDEVKAALVQSLISFSVGRELALIEDESERRVYVHQAVRSGCTAVQAAEWRIDWERRAGKRAPEGSEELAGGETGPATGVEHPCGLCGKETRPGETVILQVCRPCLEALREKRGTV